MSPLQQFHPAVRAWFEERFGAPTPPQEQGWPAILEGRHTLIAAPTGSGKTLAAFLTAIDDLVREADTAPLPDAVRVVYVSPLKALSADIHKNLAEPRRGIRQLAEASGGEAPRITAAVRTGDTTSSERAAILRRPPHILVTTPESLYLLLTAERSRALLRTVRTVIVDEIHAVIGRRVTGQECGNGFDRRLRRREADPLERRCRHLFEPLEGQGEMRAAAGVDDRVNLVDDDGLDGPEHGAAAFAGQQQEQRFRRRDEDVRRLPQHGCALALRRVAGADRDGDARRREAGALGVARDVAARHREVLVNVRAERLERRHVHHADLVRQGRAKAFAEQVIERREEGGERLAGSGRRRDERVAAGPNRLPALCLGLRRCPERILEPACDYRMKVIHGAASGRGDSLFYRSAEHAASAERSLTASFAAWALIVLLKYANTGRPRAISALSQSAQSSSTGFA